MARTKQTARKSCRKAPKKRLATNALNECKFHCNRLCKKGFNTCCKSCAILEGNAINHDYDCNVRNGHNVKNKDTANQKIKCKSIDTQKKYPPIPLNYVCHKCHQTGQHWVMDCKLSTYQQLSNVNRHYRFTKPFNTYIIQLLESIYSTKYDDKNITTQSLQLINSFCYDMIDMLSFTKSELNIKCLISKIKSMLSGKLASYAISAGNKMITAYKTAVEKSKNKRNELKLLREEKAQNEDVMHINISNISGDRFELDVSCHNTIRFVKGKIYAMKRIDIDEQELVLDGQRLDNEKTLKSFKDKASWMTIHLIERKTPELIYPYQTIGEYLKNTNKDALIFLTAVIEYLTIEILELSGKAAENSESNCIQLFHIQDAVKCDDEICKLFVDNNINFCSSWMEYDEYYYVYLSPDDSDECDKYEGFDASNEELRYLYEYKDNIDYKEQQQLINAIHNDSYPCFTYIDIANTNIKLFEYTIYGYIRTYEIKFQLLFIPKCIYDLCCEYYCICPEYFCDEEYMYNYYDISNDKLTVRRVQESNERMIVYCNKWIDSLSGTVAKWTFVINRLKDNSESSFGIVAKGATYLHNYRRPNYVITMNGYVFINGYSVITDDDHGRLCEGDTVIFTLDCINETFTWKINDKKEQLLVSPLKSFYMDSTGSRFLRQGENPIWFRSIKYKMGIELKSKGDCITLKEFTISNQLLPDGFFNIGTFTIRGLDALFLRQGHPTIKCNF